ncbi:MAG: SRPBCC domain-containing protein [Nannocystaceae bacterium]
MFYELSTPIDAPIENAWHGLVYLHDWPQWNNLVPRASGEVVVGAQLEFQIRRDDGKGLRAHRPVVLTLAPPKKIVLAASFGHQRLLRLVHSFYFDNQGSELRLRQTWDATGLLVPILRSELTKTMARFAELGEDLAKWVEQKSSKVR